MINSEKNVDIITTRNNPNELSIIKTIIEPIIRNKILSSSLFIIIFFLSIIYSIFHKPIWEGEFQIVLELENSNKTNPTLNTLRNIGLDDKDINLNTEVSILKSSSVLKPTFDYLKSIKKEKGYNVKNFYYKNWLNDSLKIGLEKNTSVLNIRYRDNDKEIIIPILNKMSISYQQYSGKNRKRTQELTNNFLKEQIAIFKNKSASSLRSAQDYALDQDLVFYDLGRETKKNRDNIPDQLLGNNPLQAPNLLLPNIGIENARVNAANQIRKINLQLAKIKELNDSEELQYIGSTIPALVAEGLPAQLSNIEADLLKARSKYTDKDINIVNLIKKRNLAIDLLKNRTIKYLEVEKLNAEATMKASMRPKDVLLKYKELIREAARDEQTLIQLEDRFNLFKLDSASQEDPWELITNPTLLEKPISPSTARILAFGFAAAIIGSILVTSIKERLQGLIISYNEIKNFLGKKELLTLYTNKTNLWNDQLSIIITYLRKKESINNIGLVPLGDIDSYEIENIYKIFSKKQTDLKISLIKKIIESKQCKHLILIGKPGCISSKNLLALLEEISLLEIPIAGWIFLEKDYIL